MQTDNLPTAVDIDEGQIRVTNSTGSRICDGLILTMPVPQILSLKGNISMLIGLLTEPLFYFICLLFITIGLCTGNSSEVSHE